MSNDTIKRHLGLQLEASCTVNANDPSSRLHLIDAMSVEEMQSRRLKHQVRQLGGKLELLGLIRDSFRRGRVLLQARRELATFRSRYPDHQALQTSTGDSLAPVVPAETLSLDRGICYLLLALLAIACLLKQRYRHGNSKVSTVLAASPKGEICFVLVHVVTTLLSPLPQSSRVAGVVSLHCLLRMFLLLYVR